MNNAQINKIYDSFPADKRNMSRADFIKEIKGLSDPVKMQQDFANIQMLKAREQMTKQRIDRSLKRGRK
jgi:hypothetical protein